MQLTRPNSPKPVAALSTRQAVWLISVSLFLAAFAFAWTVRDAVRSGFISTHGRTLFSQTYSKDDQPIRFWITLAGNCIACAGCLVGCVAIHFMGLN
jgi:hypothetical protein